MPPSAAVVKRELPHDPRKLIRRRRAAGFTQRGLALEIGCSNGHISMLEHGRHGASPPMLARIARACGCTITDLMPDEPSRIAS
jgi:transcriptional regulator with XRE-family HTH domain